MIYFAVAAVIILIILSVLVYIAGRIYDRVFGGRYQTSERLRFYMEDFPGLERTAHPFRSNKGQKLSGYLYSRGGKARGVIVIAHGCGIGGHNSYLDCVNYFTENGYRVFAFDATGNDESEGSCIGGLAQGIIDLDFALNTIKSIPEIASLPALLFGHSWGGYCVSSVLKLHSEVRGVIALSGFNRSSDLIESHGMKMFGRKIRFLLPFVRIHEFIKFKKYALLTAMKGFSSCKAKVCIVHSADDTVVPIEYGYDVYHKAFASSDRFRFIRFEDKGHSSIYVSHDAIKRINEINERFYAYRRELDYRWYDDENEARYREDQKRWYRENTNHKDRLNMLDKELFEGFVKFYDEALS